MASYKKKKFLIILISPSAGGKSTIADRLLRDRERFAYSVSYTTRLPRGLEKDRVHYNFITLDEFDHLVEKDQLLEHARVHGHWYGTGRKQVESVLETGRHVVLDIDVQGALQIMRSDIDCITVFILPPDLNVLKQRLRNRGTDTEEVIATRLKTAARELEMLNRFQYLVINDDLGTAVNEVLSIINAEENRIERYENIKNVFYGG